MEIAFTKLTGSCLKRFDKVALNLSFIVAGILGLPRMRALCRVGLMLSESIQAWPNDFKANKIRVIDRGS